MPAITDVNDLQDINLDLTGDYWLTNNIDASGFGFVPIAGNFSGTLDGRGYKITDLTITVNNNGYQYGALFFNIIASGIVKDLELEDCAINVTSIDNEAHVASISIYNSGTIQNCIVSGALVCQGVLGTSRAGGVTMNNTGTIYKTCSSVTVTINADRAASAGGFVRVNDSPGDIRECYASGNVSITSLGAGTKFRAAGFACYNLATISDCYSRGNASAVGGTDWNYAGGFVETNSDTITNSYSTGAPTGADGIGGFCRTNGDTITDSFWDTDTSGTAVSDGGTGKTTSQMKTKSTFTDADWDFTVIWFINGITNDGYPFFWAMPPEPIPESPRETVAVEDNITLKAIRNVEMAARGRFYIDKEGNACYRSRYARNA